MLVILVLLITFFIISAKVHAYTVVYDIKTINLKVGEAKIQSLSDHLLVTFHVDPLPFFKYKFRTLILLDKERISYREECLEFKNSSTNIFVYSFGTDAVIRTNKKGCPGTNIRIIPNPWKPGKIASAFVLLDRFARGINPPAPDNIVFMRDINEKVIIKQSLKDSYDLMEVKGQYVYRLHFRRMSGLEIADKIEIVKFKIYGINWNIVGLTLRSFTPDSGE
jgi:hypothetical protein